MNKKLIYTLSASALMLGACTTLDSYESEYYGEGPSVAIEVKAVADSTFTFTVTPGANTGFYSYLVTQEAEPSTLTPLSLLKNAYSGVANASINAASTPVFSSDMRSKGNPLCLPNTTYQIYAVAASQEGITGEITVVTVTTSDGLAPTIVSSSTMESGVSVSFSEAITLINPSAITAKYYAVNDMSNPVEGSVSIEADSKSLTLTSPDAPAGAYVAYSIGAGAVADSKGNPNTAVYSGDYNAALGTFGDYVYRVPNVAYDITDAVLTSPAKGTVITGADWESFKAVFTFDHDLYVSTTSNSAVQVVVKVSGKTTTIDVARKLWSVSGKQLTLQLPEQPTDAAEVSVVIKEGILFDPYGNSNNAYASSTLWEVSNPTADIMKLIIGSKTGSGTSGWYGAQTWSTEITQDADNPMKIWFSLIIPNGYQDIPVYGIVTDDMTEVHIPARQSLSATYYMCLEGYTGGDWNLQMTSDEHITGKISPDGTITLQDIIASYNYYDAAFTQYYSWYNYMNVGVTFK